MKLWPKQEAKRGKGDNMQSMEACERDRGVRKMTGEAV